VTTLTGLFDLTGLHAVVTGGNGLLGRAIVECFEGSGALVTVVDLKASQGAEAFVPCDLSSHEEISRSVAFIESNIGPIDVLVNNAASRGNSGRFFDSVEDYQQQTWDDVLAVNLDAVFWMSRAVGSLMAQRGTGSIINTSSIYASDMGVDQRVYPSGSSERMNAPASYSASKAGVVGLTRYLATYWGSAGLRVNAIAPGGVLAGQPESFQSAYAARVPLGRMASPSDLVGAYTFLASPASAYITGQCIYVDGGLSAW
jgi:NAD(P)-dependent dehydrogenase (short-subunit alcohol dehydrogenase family)